MQFFLFFLYFYLERKIHYIATVYISSRHAIYEQMYNYKTIQQAKAESLKYDSIFFFFSSSQTTKIQRKNWNNSIGQKRKMQLYWEIQQLGEASFLWPWSLLYRKMNTEQVDEPSVSGFHHTCSFPLTILYLQRGQVAFIFSHFTIHVEWKWWLQGSVWSSAPSSYGQRHIQHS